MPRTYLPQLYHLCQLLLNYINEHDTKIVATLPGPLSSQYTTLKGILAEFANFRNTYVP